MIKSKKTIEKSTTPVTPLGEDWIKSQLKTMWPGCEVNHVTIGKTFIATRLNFVEGECDVSSGPFCPPYGILRECGKLQFVRGDMRALQTLATCYPDLTIAEYLNKAPPEVPEVLINAWNKAVKETFDGLCIELKRKRVDVEREKKRKLRKAVKLLTAESYTVVSPAKPTRGKKVPKDGTSNTVK